MKTCRYKINGDIFYGSLINKNDKNFINRIHI